MLLLLQSFPPLQKHQHLNPDLHADYHDGDKSSQLGVRLNFIMYTHGVPGVGCLSDAQTCLMSALHQLELVAECYTVISELEPSAFELLFTSLSCVLRTH